MQNKLLDQYYKMLYFVKGRPTNLQRMSNYELESILKHIKKYPEGLLNGYDKSQYVDAVNYIIKCRKVIKDYRITYLESSLANKVLSRTERLTNDILKCMEYTEYKSTKKLLYEKTI